MLQNFHLRFFQWSSCVPCIVTCYVQAILTSISCYDLFGASQYHIGGIGKDWNILYWIWSKIYGMIINPLIVDYFKGYNAPNTAFLINFISLHSLYLN